MSREYGTVFGMERDRRELAARIIRAELADRRMTVTGLAIATDLGRATLTKAMRGDMTLLTMRQIAAGLDWPRSFLVNVVEGDVEAIARLPLSDTFTEQHREDAIFELRRLAMVAPINHDETGEHGNTNH